jgi:hypothetical protein
MGRQLRDVGCGIPTRRRGLRDLGCGIPASAVRRDRGGGIAARLRGARRGPSCGIPVKRSSLRNPNRAIHNLRRRVRDLSSARCVTFDASGIRFATSSIACQRNRPWIRQVKLYLDVADDLELREWRQLVEILQAEIVQG